VDDFVRQLWELHKDIKKEGIAQVHRLNAFINDRIYPWDSSDQIT